MICLVAATQEAQTKARRSPRRQKRNNNEKALHAATSRPSDATGGVGFIKPLSSIWNLFCFFPDIAAAQDFGASRTRRKRPDNANMKSRY